MLPAYGLTAFVSMHQDVWSRYSGGSGAPAWTLEMVGFDLNALEETGAAWLNGQRGGGRTEEERGVWPCGYHKLAASTMSSVSPFSNSCTSFSHIFSTLFWAGDVFAPKLRVRNKHDQEVPIQQFLQNAFLDMWEVVARAVGDLDGVIGFQVFHYIDHYYAPLISTDRYSMNLTQDMSTSPYIILITTPTSIYHTFVSDYLI